MRKVMYDSYGGPEVMRLVDHVPTQTVSGRQVKVAIHAASINPIDWKVRNGELKLVTGRQFPRGMGIDFAGAVLEAGQTVGRFHRGDLVFGSLPSFSSAGAYAEELVVDEQCLAKMPTKLSFAEAASLPTTGCAALTGLIRLAQIRSGDHVFISGCMGGVGHLAVQIALAYGATVTGSCHTRDMADAATLGVGVVLDYTLGDVGGGPEVQYCVRYRGKT